jgi:molecular chaperone DnaK
MGLSIGIDLGTTNSVAGVATPEGVKLAVDPKGKSIHASVVSFPEQGGLVVGNDAKIRKATDPAQTVYSAKRLIGQNVRSPLLQLAMSALPYPVEEGSNNQPIVVIGGRRMMVPEVSAFVLAYLKRLCEEQFGEEVVGAVITVPANFSDAQRQGTKEAGRLAGLEVLRLVNEPTAAALAYGYGQEMNQRIAVFDFGGGTFDLSVLKIDSDIFEVLATDGEFFLGGDDIDRMVAEFLASEMNRTQKIDPRPIPTAMNRLNIAAEQIKQYLTTNDMAGGSIDGIVVGDSGQSLSVDFQLSRDDFNMMIEGYVDRTIDVCRNVLTTVDIKPEDIDDLLLVGGSTRIPLVRQRLTEYFGKEPATRINPDEVVAHGAAIQASMLSGSLHQSKEAEDGADEAKLAENAVPMDLGFTDDATPPRSALLLDVTPAALRIATAGGYTEAFLEKNSPIPIERTKAFTTAQPNQSRVVIQCYRGPHQAQSENELLGTLVLDEIPPGERGEAKIQVTFRIDPDCILHVRAQDMRTDQEVEARLNVIGAPVAEVEQVHVSNEELPVSASDKSTEKQRLKKKKEQEKLEKKKKKAEEKNAKKEKKRAESQVEDSDEDTDGDTED